MEETGQQAGEGRCPVGLLIVFKCIQDFVWMGHGERTDTERTGGQSWESGAWGLQEEAAGVAGCKGWGKHQPQSSPWLVWAGMGEAWGVHRVSLGLNSLDSSDRVWTVGAPGCPRWALGEFDKGGGWACGPWPGEHAVCHLRELAERAPRPQDVTVS